MELNSSLKELHILACFVLSSLSNVPPPGRKDNHHKDLGSADINSVDDENEPRGENGWDGRASQVEGRDISEETRGRKAQRGKKKLESVDRECFSSISRRVLEEGRQ